jgi:YD repeat-containing protein
MISASYNAANQQSTFGSQSLTFDLNGNLTSDGLNTYAWDVRDQLIAMSGAGLTASFQYDADGRRVSKTVNGATTTFLYDGVNFAQEQVEGTASANRYVAYDSEGRLLRLVATEPRITIESAEATPTHSAHVRDALIEALRLSVLTGSGWHEHRFKNWSQ